MRLDIVITNELYPSWWINLMKLDSFAEVLETIRHAGGVYHDGLVDPRWIKFDNEKDATIFLLRWS
jgi:hypothetical protein